MREEWKGFTGGKWEKEKREITKEKYIIRIQKKSLK